MNVKVINNQQVLVVQSPGPQGPPGDNQSVLDLSGKADKIVGGQTGNFVSLNAQGNIQDSGHKHADYITNVTGKADKAVGAVVGDFASFDSSGNPVDSGHKHADYATRVSGATNGNFAGLDAQGNLVDSGHKHSDYVTSVTGKADKVLSPTAGNFAGLDVAGNLTDSGHKHADYAAAVHTHTSSQISDANSSNVPNTIVKRDALGASSFDYVNAGVQLKVGNVLVYENPTGILNVSSNITATSFTGDGSQLTSIPRTAITGLGSAATKNADNTAGNTVLLDGAGLLPTSVLPPLAVNDTFVVASQTAMLALTAQRGDMAIRTDVNKTFVLSTDNPATLADWKELLSPGSVASVNGQTGVVLLTTSNIGEGTNLYYTTARVNTDAPNVTLGTANGLSLSGQQLSLGLASGSAAGAMSSADYTKLQGIASGAQPGTVTSVGITVPSWLTVGGSPVTTTGTLAVTANNQNANLVLAGPGSGGAAAPGFRSLVTADLPSVIVTGQVKATVTTTSYTSDVSQGCNFLLDLQSNFTLNNPTNSVDKQVVIWRLRQDATGGRTITLGGAFLVPGNVTLALSKSANAVDVLIAQYDATATKWHVLEFINENSLRCVEVFPICFDGGGSVVTTTGSDCYGTIPYECDIVGWDLLADVSGNLTVELETATYANYPTTTSITGSSKPSLSSAQKNSDIVLSGWTTYVPAGTTIKAYLSGTPATIKKATLNLKVRRR